MKTKFLKQLFLGLAMVLSMGAWGQNQWYFGHGAGLDFTDANFTTPPVFFSGNQMKAMEGCAMGFDKNGKIILYTDGKDVWWNNNGTHVKITDSSNQLKSSTSSTSAATLIPLSCDRFVVITVNMMDHNDTFYVKNSLYYSIITLNGNNLPTITTPAYLYGDITTDIIFSEKLAIYKNHGKDEYWVVVHDFTNKSDKEANTFISFKIDSNLLNQRPAAITSKIGKDHKHDFFSGVGQMKISNNGNYIAYANKVWVEIFKFNTANGKVESTNKPNSILRNQNNYGIEFSKDDKFLYYSNLYSSNEGVYRIPVDNFEQSNEVKLNISSTGSAYNFGALQFGPDGALYCGKGAAGTEQNDHILRIVNPETSNPTVSNIKVINGSASLTNRAMVGLPTLVTGLVDCNTTTTCECNDGFTNIIVQNKILQTRLDGKPLYYACGNTHNININETQWMRPLLSCMGKVNGIRPRVTYSIRNEAGISIVTDRELPQLNMVDGAISVFNTTHFIKLSKGLFPSCGLYTITFTGSCCAEVCGTCEIKVNVTGCETPKDCITCCLPSTLKDINDNKLFLNQFRNPNLDYQPSANFKTLLNNYLSTIQVEASENNCQLKEDDVEIKLNFYKYNGNANPNDINRTLIRTDFRAFQNAQNSNFQILSTHSATANTNFENLLTLNGWYIVELSIKVKNKPDCSTSLIVIKDNNLGKRKTPTNSNKNNN